MLLTPLQHSLTTVNVTVRLPPKIVHKGSWGPPGLGRHSALQTVDLHLFSSVQKLPLFGQKQVGAE